VERDGDRREPARLYEAQEAALAGTGGGMLLEDCIRLRRTQA